jgi:hypothetical protein
MRLVGIRAISATLGFGVLAAGCSGVLVRGVDIRQIPTVQGHADDTTLETPPVRLVCEGRVGVLVAVADPETVHYLESRYPSVVVSGWLQPVSGW